MAKSVQKYGSMRFLMMKNALHTLFILHDLIPTLFILHDLIPNPWTGNLIMALPFCFLLNGKMLYFLKEKKMRYWH